MTDRILCTTDITVVYLGRQTGDATKEILLGSIPLRLSFLFKKVVVCGHYLVSRFALVVRR